MVKIITRKADVFLLVLRPGPVGVKDSKKWQEPSLANSLYSNIKDSSCHTGEIQQGWQWQSLILP